MNRILRDDGALLRFGRLNLPARVYTVVYNIVK